MPGYTPSHNLRYPLGTERPKAADIKNLADDTDTALGPLPALDAIYGVKQNWTPLAIGAPFSAVSAPHTPEYCVVGPFVYLRGMVTFVGSTFYGANMVWLPSAYGPGTTQHFNTTKVQNLQTVLQLQVSPAGAVSCAGTAFALGTAPASGGGNAISIAGSWVRQGVL